MDSVPVILDLNLPISNLASHVILYEVNDFKSTPEFLMCGIGPLIKPAEIGEAVSTYSEALNCVHSPYLLPRRTNWFRREIDCGKGALVLSQHSIRSATMSSKQGGKAKPLKKPKSEKAELDDIDKNYLQKKREEEKALKELKIKAQTSGAFGGAGLKKSGKK
ncbi:unnamed protein product [Cuscuta europaea]|uniref:Translation machinery-associated protein 7 homolog n=1 Tax=Cuscuta europaea TaxID=41803 RepID=A0A9P0Z6A7_CUSEU|nr:unnamed protein product [Cuscuta europaea]